MKSQVSPCMFCGELPCQCSQSSTPKAGKPKASKPGLNKTKRTFVPGSRMPSIESSPSSSVAPSSVDFSENPFKTTTPDRFTEMQDTQGSTDDEVTMRNAMRNLWHLSLIHI